LHRPVVIIENNVLLKQINRVYQSHDHVDLAAPGKPGSIREKAWNYS
jgi:hypothetical protein